MVNQYYIAAAAILLLVLPACGEGPVGGGPHRDDVMTASINGRRWESVKGEMLAQWFGRSLSISGTARSDSSELTLTMGNVTGPGTYAIDESGDNRAAFTTASSSYQTASAPGAGTITIIRGDSAALTGTFQFTATATTQSADSERVIVVRDGTFEVRFR
jgi:hypothetical protein